MHACTNICSGSRRRVTRWHDWKHRLWAESEIESAALMNSGQNHFRHSLHKIDSNIVINGNSSCCSFSSSLPGSLFLLLTLYFFIPLSTLPPLSPSESEHHFSASLNPTFLSKESPSMRDSRGSNVPAASALWSPHCLCRKTTGDVAYRGSQKLSPQIGSHRRAVSASGGKSVQSAIGLSLFLYVTLYWFTSCVFFPLRFSSFCCSQPWKANRPFANLFLGPSRR